MRRPLSGLIATSLLVSVAVLAGIVGACTGDDPVLHASPVGDGGSTGDVDEVGMHSGDRPCDPTKDFDPPIPVGGLATTEYAESAARFSPDERVAYFTRIDSVDASPDFPSNLYTASRASATLAFDAPRLVMELSEADGLDDSPTVTADGAGFFFTRRTIPGGVYKSTGKHSPFASAELLPALSNVYGDSGTARFLSPYVLPDGSALYIAKQTSEAGQGGIHRAARGSGAYDDLQAVNGLGGNPDQDDNPVVTADELTLYWASVRGATATRDIYVATRADAKSPFTGVRRIDSLSTMARDERPTFVSADGCRLYFSSSTRPIEPGSASDIFVATKPK